jgi:hypothetical protein
MGEEIRNAGCIADVSSVTRSICAALRIQNLDILPMSGEFLQTEI